MKLPRFDSASVLVIGDLMLDRYWHGSTGRVSAEAPVPVVDVKEIEDRPGAAANVALNVASLGAKSALVGMIGDDEAGSVLAEKLGSAGIDCYFARHDGYRTTTKLRIVSKNQQLLRADFEEQTPLDLSVLQQAVTKTIDAVDNVLLSDYDKGVITDRRDVIASARKL